MKPVPLRKKMQRSDSSIKVQEQEYYKVESVVHMSEGLV